MLRLALQQYSEKSNRCSQDTFEQRKREKRKRIDPFLESCAKHERSKMGQHERETRMVLKVLESRELGLGRPVPLFSSADVRLAVIAHFLLEEVCLAI